jgi:hypothetical protein
MMIQWEGFSRKRSWPNSKALSRHWPEGTKENHEKKDCLSPEPIFEPGTSRIRNRSVNLSMTTFGKSSS